VLAQLDAIPGVGRRTAEVLLAEGGLDLSRFPSAGHLAAWAELAPGNNERAGKARRAPARKGSPWLRAVLVEAAQAAGRSKDSYLSAQYRRLAARRGKKRAAVAVAHSILTIAYQLLTTPAPYRDYGVTYFDQRDRQAVERRLVRRLEARGYTVSLQPPTSVA
jgi:transposase